MTLTRDDLKQMSVEQILALDQRDVDDALSGRVRRTEVTRDDLKNMTAQEILEIDPAVVERAMQFEDRSTT